MFVLFFSLCPEASILALSQNNMKYDSNSEKVFTQMNYQIYGFQDK
jgi:hypothetical protein